MRINQYYKGGILLTTLLFVFLFSFLFVLVLEDFQLTQRFTQKTKDYYSAKIMVSMFLSDVKQEQYPLEKAGNQHFSTGTLHYEYKQPTLNLTVQLKQTTYTFQEKYLEREKEKVQIQKEQIKSEK
ncbi:competence type IV pilus minor pilin ComGG [Enterococcus silesiacus]|nr:competence type IV pilus minor pilin ComGG [Enterococcus silesiacus]